jgi:hypothetical protein
MTVTAIDTERSAVQIMTERDWLCSRFADIPGAAGTCPDIGHDTPGHDPQAREHDGHPEQGGCRRCEELRHRQCRAPFAESGNEPEKKLRC